LNAFLKIFLFVKIVNVNFSKDNSNEIYLLPLKIFVLIKVYLRLLTILVSDELFKYLLGTGCSLVLGHLILSTATFQKGTFIYNTTSMDQSEIAVKNESHSIKNDLTIENICL